MIFGLRQMYLFNILMVWDLVLESKQPNNKTQNTLLSVFLVGFAKKDLQL